MHAQQAEVVAFRHDLRLVDETRFPNYFQVEEFRDSIFTATKQELQKYLNRSEIQFPEDVFYSIINGFRNQKIKMPTASPSNEYEVDIYSFITRNKVEYAVLWKFNLVIKKSDKVVLKIEVVYELEHYNVSGYLTTVKWLEPDKFQSVFIRLLKEALGILPPSDEVIVIGSVEELEAKAKELIHPSKRHMLKVDGNWRMAENFVAQLETPTDTVLHFKFKDKISWEFPKPSFTGFLAQLFSEMTKIEVVYDKAIKRQRKASLIFSDDEEVGILLKWIEIETHMTHSDEVLSRRIVSPLVAELYSKDRQIGYFVYMQEEYVNATDKTESTFNVFTGHQIKNSLGVERVHRMEGKWDDKPFLAEYNENLGVIEVRGGDASMGVMVIENINPKNRSISNERLSKNKVFITAGKIGKPSLTNVSSQEWFPLYLPEGASDASGKVCVQSLIFLFFGMGNM